APFGQKVRHALQPPAAASQPAAPGAQPARSLAAPATETAVDRMTPPARVEQTTAPTWPATTADDAAQAGAFAARWSHQPKPAEASPAAQTATSAPALASAMPQVDLPRAASTIGQQTTATRVPIAQEQDATDVQDADAQDDAPPSIATEAAST